MSFLKKVTKLCLLLLAVVAFSSACSGTRKNPYYQKRIQASKSNTKQLGRNKYYFSNTYQKKLAKSYKRK
ncbi:MAG: hypothetical protein GX431_01570 [Bacteroidales bacterium]|mgnify:CR=1 FL=1|jgi:hypothetical protein|nr:hypothetical protein [Bacteroidales bacterium]